jgi:Ca-activated chloride channel homolog
MSLSFAWSWLLLLLPLPWLLARRRTVDLAVSALRMPPSAFVAADTAAASSSATTRRAIGWREAVLWALVVIAAARPQAPGEVEYRPASGRDWMLALDVSASMATRDLGATGHAESRLAAARQAAKDFIAGRPGDRFGLIVFASQAWLYAPLSWDVAAIEQAIAAAQVGLAGRETALGDAVALGTKRLGEAGEAATTHELVLISDGANTAGALSPQQAGWLAERAEVRVHGLEIGRGAAGAGGSPLAQLAAQTGGHFAHVTDATGLAAFYAELARQSPLERTRPLVEPQELYAWPLGLALLLGLAFALPRRPTPAVGPARDN